MTFKAMGSRLRYRMALTSCWKVIKMDEPSSMSNDQAVKIQPLKPSMWLLAWHQLWRDIKGGELRLVLIAVALAVSALTAVGFFVDRFQQSLIRDAASLLGGDAVVTADQPIPDSVRRLSVLPGLRQSETAKFPSMAIAPEDKGGSSTLVSVKSVDSAYPLRGRVTVQRALDGGTEDVAHGPSAGAVWLERAAADALGLQPGDAIQLGNSTLKLDAILIQEPDRGAGLGSFSPRLMMSNQDLPATELIQPASRVSWRLALVGEGAQGQKSLTLFSQKVDELIKSSQWRGADLDTLASDSPEMGQTLQRAQQFLQLVALLAALLAAVAVGVASQDFARRRLDASAMLRVLGLSQGQILTLHWMELLGVAVFASVVGVVLGLLFHQIFILLLASLVQAQFPAPTWKPAWMGAGAGVILVMGFALPPVLQLAKVPPLRVMRRELGRVSGATYTAFATGLLSLVALLMTSVQDVKLGAITVGGFVAALAVFAAVAWLCVLGLEKTLGSHWIRDKAPTWLGLVTRQLSARRSMVILQISALGLGLLAIFLLILLRTDLMNGWKNSTPADAPNRFVISIQPDQAQDFQQKLRQGSVQRYDWYPMFRGRLVAVNGKAVDVNAYAEGRARRLVDREFNLSHAEQLPDANDVVGGQWTPNDAKGLSIEEGIAKTLGLTLGDQLQFDVAGQMVDGKITSIRKVDWASMRVNFFVLFPRSDMSDMPVSYISSYRSPGPDLDKSLAKEFPNVTQIDVGATLAQVQHVVSQVSQAVEFLFVFALGCGLVVLAATVVASREERMRDFAIMRALGASTTMLSQVQRAELLVVGAVAGCMASMTAALVGWILAKQVFEFDWSLPWTLLSLGAVVGALMAWISGSWSLRGVVSVPVVEALRRLN